MTNEKIVLHSPEPIYGNEKKGGNMYIISGVCGLGIALFLSLLGGTFDLLAILVMTVLAVLVGWGIKNKKLKYRSLMLRKMKFLVEEKPTETELQQRLLPVLNSLNMKMELDNSGIICILVMD